MFIGAQKVCIFKANKLTIRTDASSDLPRSASTYAPLRPLSAADIFLVNSVDKPGQLTYAAPIFFYFQLVAAYQQGNHSCFLYLAGVLVDVFGDLPECRGGLVALFEVIFTVWAIALGF